MVVVKELLPVIEKWPVVGFLVKYILDSNLKVIGMVAVMILAGLYLLKEGKELVDLFKPILNLFRKKNGPNKDDLKREHFYEVSTSPEFVKWQNKVLKKIYSDLNLLTLFGRDYPILIHEAKDNFSYPFNEKVSGFAQLNSTDLPEFEYDKGQRAYFNMMKSTIKRPKLVGFEIDEFNLDDDDKIEGFSAKVCQYEQNVVTSHILDYEMYKYYQKRGEKALDKSGEELLTELSYRKKIHTGKTQREVVSTGCNRHSLLSVQMLVVFKDKNNTYRALMIKRSKNVAIKPNYWQLIPAGGFEIFEREDTTSKLVIKQNFNIELALFRELIEEAFNGADFEDNESGNEFEVINKHKDVIYIKELLKKKDAHLEFIGNVVDLVSLRPELSFLLVVDNPEFADMNFKKNHEGKDLQVIKVNEIPDLLEDGLLYPSSAGLLKLAMKSQLFAERGLLQEM